ncbi:DUF2812 domain-containing protein [Solibacillus sp. FSL R7-0668]|uniref:DUF2812 domain-containing protein n=1 Tax=Solibacillus sp. FSL R7-0668 TaxID=2921688 RepID=UPI0030F9811B
MGKKRKLVPVKLWQRGQMESWLSEQAQHGLKLEKFNNFIATFQKAEPQSLEYRMIVMHEKDSYPANTNELEQAGWDYVASYQYYHIFCSQQADPLSEIEELSEQAASFDGILKQTRNQILIYSFSIVVLFAMALLFFRDNPKPITNLIEGYLLSSLFIIFINSWIGIAFLYEFLMIRRVKKQLEQGIALDYRASWRLSGVKRYFWNSSYYVITVVIAFTLIKQVNNQGYETLAENTEDLPLLRLVMIEAPETRIKIEMEAEEVGRQNSLMKNWTFFAPVQYTVQESVVIARENKPFYNPQLEYQIIECTVPSLGKALFEEWATYYEVHKEPHFSHTAFDRVLVEKIYEDTVRILTIKDNRVQYVDYIGEASIEAILEALENL